MSSGTKVATALIVLLVGVLAVYYGFIFNNDEPLLASASGDSPPASASHAPVRTPPPGTQSLGRQQPGSIPTDPLGHRDAARDSAADRSNSVVPVRSSEQAPKPDLPLALFPTLRSTAAPMSDGGKDLPTPAAPPPSNDVRPVGVTNTPRPLVDAPEKTNSTTERSIVTPPRAANAPLEAPRFQEYLVQPGDTMSSIAGDWFGDINKWDLIAKANPLIDPNKLKVNQKLRLPPKDARREQIKPAAAAETTGKPAAGGSSSSSTVKHTVAGGESLISIARTYYGSDRMWKTIFDANKSVIGSDPDALKVGMVLTIPPALKPAR